MVASTTITSHASCCPFQPQSPPPCDGQLLLCWWNSRDMELQATLSQRTRLLWVCPCAMQLAFASGASLLHHRSSSIPISDWRKQTALGWQLRLRVCMACSPHFSFCLSRAGASAALPSFPAACHCLHGCSLKGRSRATCLSCSMFVCHSTMNNLEAVPCWFNTMHCSGTGSRFSRIRSPLLLPGRCCWLVSRSYTLGCKLVAWWKWLLSRLLLYLWLCQSFSASSYSGEPRRKPSLTFLSAPL